MSFVIDPPLLVASGAAIEVAAGEDEASARRLRGGVVALFVLVSMALYANAPGLGRLWRPFGSRSGREFMLTSGSPASTSEGSRAVSTWPLCRSSCCIRFGSGWAPRSSAPRAPLKGLSR